jgi:hypothetical protein
MGENIMIVVVNILLLFKSTEMNTPYHVSRGNIIFPAVKHQLIPRSGCLYPDGLGLTSEPQGNGVVTLQEVVCFN